MQTPFREGRKGAIDVNRTLPDFKQRHPYAGRREGRDCTAWWRCQKPVEPFWRRDYRRAADGLSNLRPL